VKKHLSISNSFIIISLFILTIGQFIPVEIQDGLVRFSFYLIILVCLPILAYRKIKHKLERIESLAQKVLVGVFVTCLIGFYSIFFLILGVGKLMCSYSTDEKLYIRKGIGFSSIIVRHYGCGAYDSDLPKTEIVNRINFLSIVQIVPTIDTATINKENWIKITDRQ
jgi:hypothetical protein